MKAATLRVTRRRARGMESGKGADSSIDRLVGDPTRTSANWKNPSRSWRIALVAASWSIPGMLLGLLASLFLPSILEPSIAASVGTILGGIAGARLEWSD